MKINDGIITLSKSELRKIYNKSSEENKTLLKEMDAWLEHYNVYYNELSDSPYTGEKDE